MLEKLTFIEFVLRSIPEVLIFTFAAYAFSRVRFNFKNWIISSAFLSVSVFLVRSLPINYGVHTILNLIIQTVIITYICKINTIKLIKSGIITTMLLLLSEGVSVYIYTQIFKIDMTLIFQDNIKRVLYGMPSLIIFAICIGYYYYYLDKRKKLCNV